MSVVVDTSAVLAMLWSEPGGEAVEAVLDKALLSAVNLSELVAKLADRGGSDDQIAQVLAALALPVADFDADQADMAGKLIRETKAGGLSLGDRACLALGLRDGATVITADRTWADLGLDMTIETVR